MPGLTCCNSCGWNIGDQVLVDQPLALLGHRHSQILLVMVAAEFDHRKHEQRHPDGEGNPDSELSRGHLDVEAVGVDVVSLVWN